MASLKEQFLEGMSRSAASVSIVTTDGAAGRAGVTVSAMSSVSADGDKPTMLVCLNETSKTLPVLLDNGCFCINVLELGQQSVADVFSGRVPAPNDDRFCGQDTRPGPTGAPMLSGALVSFDCRLVSAEKIGTHHVCIGAVEGVVTAAEGSPLLYGMRRYLRTEAH